MAMPTDRAIGLGFLALLAFAVSIAAIGGHQVAAMLLASALVLLVPTMVEELMGEKESRK